MATREEEALRRVLALSGEMVALSSSDALAGDDVGLGIVLGTLRDSGYNLRRLAERELGRRRVEPPTEAAPVEAPAAPPEPDPGPSGTPAQEASPRKVLVVEDDPDTLTFLRAWFEDRGFAVSTATDGVAALDHAARIRPDLVTLDLSMPERSGLEVLRRLKARADLRRVPVLVITAVDDRPRRLADAGAGPGRAEGFLSKPVDLGDLSEMVRKLLT